MSIRTIVEINHDYLSDLEDPKNISRLLNHLRTGDYKMQGAWQMKDTKPTIAPGVRVLRERHHSEKFQLDIS